jgi:hypothetical protein
MLLYSASLPSYSGYKKKGAGAATGEEVVRADDPANKEDVLAILRGQKF